jgi:phage gpG-like protein
MVKPVDVKVEAKGLESALDTLQLVRSMGNTLSPVMRTIGDIMYKGVIENFEAEGRPDKWQKRKDMTIQSESEGRYNDFLNTKRGKSMYANSLKYKRSKNALSRNKSSIFNTISSNKILQDRGALRESIDVDPRSNSVAVGSNLVYARIHQFGGVIRPKKGNCLCIPVADGKIIKVKSVTIPARPYLVIMDKENAEILEATVKYYKGCIAHGDR